MSRSKVKVTKVKNGFRLLSRKPLNGFATHSLVRRVWSLARTSLKVKVNFGGMRAVYVWKNIFALVIGTFLETCQNIPKVPSGLNIFLELHTCSNVGVNLTLNEWHEWHESVMSTVWKELASN